MMSYFEAAVGMLNFAGPSGQARAARIAATGRWVRAACERDGYPDWLVDMVMTRVVQALLAGDFPLIEMIEPDEPETPPVAPSPKPPKGLDAVYVVGARPKPLPRPSELDALRGEPGPPLERDLERDETLLVRAMVTTGLTAALMLLTLVTWLLTHLSVR